MSENYFGHNVMMKEGHLSTLNILCVLFNIILASLICITTVYYRSELLWQLTDRNVPTELCINCAEIQQYPDDPLQNVTTKDNGRTCCTKPTDAAELVRRFTSNWSKKKMLTEAKLFTHCINETKNLPEKALIKVMGVNQKQDKVHHKLSWNSSSVLAINGGNHISYNERDKEIRVHKTGMYHVYSQVTFEYDNHNSTDFVQNNHLLLFSHMVIRLKHGDENVRSDTLLKTMQTACESNDINHEVSSYIGSVFQLERGDRLFVKVNFMRSVKSVPHLNYFGAHVI